MVVACSPFGLQLHPIVTTSLPFLVPFYKVVTSYRLFRDILLGELVERVDALDLPFLVYLIMFKSDIVHSCSEPVLVSTQVLYNGTAQYFGEFFY